MRTAETMRIAPKRSLSAAAGTMPTSRPPTTAPTTDPMPIGATVCVRSWRSSKAPSLRWRRTPTATVGKLMSRLAVPAVLMPAPKTNTSVGMISSPPATPNKLLTIPIASPKSTATTIRNGRESGSKAGTSCGKNASTIRAEPTTTSSTSMNRSSVRSEMRCTSATPTNAADTAPAIMATTRGSRAMRGARSNVPPRISRAPRTVIRLMARLRATARRAAYLNTPANTGRRNSAPPNPMRPPRSPIGAPYSNAATGERWTSGLVAIGASYAIHPTSGNRNSRKSRSCRFFATLHIRTDEWYEESEERKAALVERAAPRRNPQEKDTDVNEEQQARGGVVTSYKDAPTRTVSAGGVDFAYRELGPKAGVPLIFLVHLAGVLDHWDPRVVDGIAAKHRVIAFDNRGVGASTGKTPDTIQAMAKDAVTFIRALGFDQVDLHGFSMGGMIAQVIARDEPELVRKLILTGTGPAGGKGMKEVVWVAQVDTLRGLLSRQDPKQFLFFTRTANGKREGKAFLARLQERTIDRDTPTSLSSYFAQLKACRRWGKEEPHDLSLIRHPVLLANGDNDRMLPTPNTLDMARRLPNNELVIYPDAGHGGIFQFHEQFVEKALEFLAK